MEYSASRPPAFTLYIYPAQTRSLIELRYAKHAIETKHLADFLDELRPQIFSASTTCPTQTLNPASLDTLAKQFMT